MNRWKWAFVISLIANLILFGGGSWYMGLFKAGSLLGTDESVSLEFIDDSALDTPNVPEVAKPEPKKVDIPMPPTEEELQQIKDGIPVEEVLKINKKDKVSQDTSDADKPRDGDANKKNNPPGGNPKGLPIPSQEPVIVPPEVVSRPSPVELPKNLRESDFNGAARILVRVGMDGSVVSAEIADSSGNDEADQLARAKAYEYGFAPGTVDGEATELPAYIVVRMSTK